MTLFLLTPEPVFPDPALADEDGLLAVGGDLSPRRLLAAYRQGIFPWYSENTPILWWSPAPRFILEPKNLHVPTRLELLRQGQFSLSGQAGQVISFCAQVSRPGGAAPDRAGNDSGLLRTAQSGFTHSAGRRRTGGGVYAFRDGLFVKSICFLRPNASKAGLVTLVRALHQAGFSLFDCQQTTAHMARFGGFEVSREEFSRRLKQALTAPTLRGAWTLESLTRQGGIHG